MLDVWEQYFGRRLGWYFRDTYPRLELIPLVETDNAWSKYGYIECGFSDFWTRRRKLFCENFDVVAHEVGHCITHEVIGCPSDPRSLQYRALDEALADVIAIVSSLHFDSVVDYLLRCTRGNLFSVNVLSRIGEKGPSQQIRKAFNNERMSTVKWDPVADRHKYALAKPFVGGAFDVFVEVYQHYLTKRGTISRALAERSYGALHREAAGIRRAFARQFKTNRKVFKEALLDARDYFGKLLARTLDRTSMSDPSYLRVVANMIDADAELSGGECRKIIRQSFEWREIVPRASE